MVPVTTPSQKTKERFDFARSDNSALGELTGASSQRHPPLELENKTKAAKLLRQRIVAHVIRNRCGVSLRGSETTAAPSRGSHAGVTEHILGLFNL